MSNVSQEQWINDRLVNNLSYRSVVESLEHFSGIFCTQIYCYIDSLQRACVSFDDTGQVEIIKCAAADELIALLREFYSICAKVGNNASLQSEIIDNKLKEAMSAVGKLETVS